MKWVRVPAGEQLDGSRLVAAGGTSTSGQEAGGFRTRKEAERQLTEMAGQGA